MNHPVGGFQIAVQDVIPVLLLHIGKEDFLRRPGIVHQHIHPAEPSQHLPAEGIGILPFGQIGAEHLTVLPQRQNPVFQLLGGLFLTAAVYRHGIARLGKSHGHGLPDSAGSPSNQHRFHQLTGATAAASSYWVVSLVKPSSTCTWETVVSVEGNATLSTTYWSVSTFCRV